MNIIWLERFGIILNCLAGFMVAPELIGVDRLTRLSSFLQKKISTVQRVMRRLKIINWADRGNILIAYLLELNPQRENQDIDSQYIVAYLLLFMFSVTLWIAAGFFYYLFIENPYIIIIGFPAFLTLNGLSIMILFKVGSRWLPAKYIAGFLYMFNELVLGWAAAVLYLFLVILNLFVQLIFNFISQHMIRKSLIAAGIFLYLTGTFLQLVATFR